MTETKTVVTTKEVEMVECSSCGQEIEKDEAHYFMIRNEKNERDFSRRTEGWACQYCVEKPISFPVMYRTLGENTGWFELIAGYLVVFLSILMIAQILSII